jgi:Co/Zn/Cd efflux system component
VKDCCEVHEVPRRQRRVLRAVLWINAVMFLVESVAGVLAHSSALFADSVDMLGDAVVYGFSLYVVGRGPAWQARAGLVKGITMAAFGAGVLVQVGYKLAHGLAPAVEVMGTVGLLALAANLLCLSLLRARRDDDLNMRSAWVCSRNDVIGNAAVLTENRRAPQAPSQPFGGPDAQAALLREERLRLSCLQSGGQGQRPRHDPLHLGSDRRGCQGPRRRPG